MTSGRSVQPGAPLAKIQARDWNAMLQLVEKDRQGSVNRVNSVGDGQWGASSIIKVKNLTGRSVGVGDALGIGGPLVGPRADSSEIPSDTILRGVLASGETFNRRVAVLLEPLGQNDIGRAVISGVVFAFIYAPQNVPRNEGDFATVQNSLTRLERTNNQNGCPILWIDDPANIDETGHRWALVSLTPAAPTTASQAPSWMMGPRYFGCDLSDCLQAGSRWLDPSKPCMGCEATPDHYAITFFSAGSTRCCGEKLWQRSLPIASDDFPNTRDIILYRSTTANCRWESKPIECRRLGTECGNARYRWNAGFREKNCDVVWRWTQAQVFGRHEWIGDGAGGWVLDFSACTSNDGVPLMPAMPPSRPSLGWNDRELTPCVPVYPYYWLADYRSDCGDPPGTLLGGPRWAPPTGGAYNYGTCYDAQNNVSVPLGPPVGAPNGGPSVVTRRCRYFVEDPNEAGWVLITPCTCGTASPPARTGLYDGEIVSVECEQSELYGELYTQPTYVRWVLRTEGEPATLRLEDAAGGVVFEYRLQPPRSWCCTCANPMVLVSCGPYPCDPPAFACVRAKIHASCDAACIGQQFEITVDSSSMPTAQYPLPCWDQYLRDNTVNELDDCDFTESAPSVGEQCDMIAGTFLLENEGLDEFGNCVWRYSETRSGAACGGDWRLEWVLKVQSGETIHATLTVTISNTNASPIVLSPSHQEERPHQSTHAKWEGDIDCNNRRLQRVAWPNYEKFCQGDTVYNHIGPIDHANPLGHLLCTDLPEHIDLIPVMAA